MARKPITCGTALRRTIIIRNESNTVASAMPRVERVMVLAICEIGVASEKAKMARPIPVSMVVGMLISVSTSQRMYRRSIRRCSTHGIRMTFNTRVRPAEKYRCICPVAYATIAVEAASAAPCQEEQVLPPGGVRETRGGGGGRGPLPGEQLDEREHAPLRQHGEREQQQQRREQVDELAAERLAHGQPRTRKWVSMPSTASRNAPERHSETRNRRILARNVSMSASPAPASASLPASAARSEE